MRPIRLLPPVCLALILSMAPAATHAVSYKKYVSMVCPYSVKYPGNWFFRAGIKHDTFSYESSPRQFAQILVSCAYNKYHHSIKRLTAAVASAYAKRGYSLAAPQYKGNELGLFFGQTNFKVNRKTYPERLHVSTLIYQGRAWVMALAGDSADFDAGEHVYTEVLATFTPRSH